MARPTAPALRGPSARPPAPAPTHACVRCGAPVPLDVAMCERCNPLGLSDPAATQVHGTVFVAVVLAVVILAVLGRVVTAGIGPFDARIVDVVPESPGLRVTLTVTNEGSAAGSTTCRIHPADVAGIGPQSAYLTSPRIEPGRTVTFQRLVTTLGPDVRPLRADCSSP